MLCNHRLAPRFFVLTLALCFFGVQSASAAIYQWEYDSAGNVVQSSTLCVDGANANARLNANLAGLNLTQAYLKGKQLGKANLSNAIFVGANFNGATLTSATLTNADLSDAIIASASFSFANITADQLYSTKSYKDKILTGVSFLHDDLSGWNFAGQDLTGASFSSADLTNADLSNANLSRVTFLGANLNNAVISGANFSQTDLTSSQLYSTASYKNKDLRGVSLNKIDTTGWSFAGQNLDKAIFGGNSLTNVIFTDALVTDAVLGNIDAPQVLSTASYKSKDMHGISVSNSNFAGLNFSERNLSHASFVRANLSGADFTSANLSEANFYAYAYDYASNLTDAVFTNATIAGASFFGNLTLTQLCSTMDYKNKDLHGIGLRNCDLSDGDFASQDISGAVLASVKLVNASLEYANLSGANLEGSVSTNANLTGANLANADFVLADVADANFFDAIITGANFSHSNFCASQLYSTKNFKSKDLRNLSFAANNLSGWNFSGQNLSGGNMYSAILTNAILVQANLADATLCYADLTGADLTEANVTGVDFTGCGLTQSQLYTTANYKNKSLTGISFVGWYFTGVNLSGQNLTDSKFVNSTLSGAELTDANISGADFGVCDLSEEQLGSTASYKSKDLRGVQLWSLDLTNWNFSGQCLWNANFYGSTLTYADLRGADLRGVTNLSSTEFAAALTTNAIGTAGVIKGLCLTNDASIVVRNYSPAVSKWQWSSPISSISVHVTNGMTMDESGTLKLVFDGAAWNSTISFDSGIAVSLGGTLSLAFASKTDALSDIGKTYKAFDWTGVTPTGTFAVSSDAVWDTSKLYSTGQVTLTYASGISDTQWTGAKSNMWSDAGNWTNGAPTTDAIIEFNSTSPTRQPIVQNVASPLSLKGLMFAPNAGSHVLSGPALKLEGDAPSIVNASSNDQYVGNDVSISGTANVIVAGVGQLVLGGEISGDGRLTKKGTGTLVLENTALHAGGTVVEEGVLALDATGQVSGPVENAATLEVLGGSHTIGAITGSGTTVVRGDSVIVVGTLVQDTLILGGDGSAAAASPAAVPEPATLLTLALFGVYAAFIAKRRR